MSTPSGRERNERRAGGLWFCPAAERNGPHIENVLRTALPATGRVLEIASGTGQHVVRFASAFPRIRWQPSELDADLCRNIERVVAEAGLTNVAAPRRLDVLEPWSLPGPFDAVLTVNLLHIAPWPVTAALFAGAASVLVPTGKVIIYGPFRRGGEHTSPGNRAFDETLRAENPEWGVRDVEAVVETAEAHGFELARIIDMPANNLIVVFGRSPAGSGNGAGR